MGDDAICCFCGDWLSVDRSVQLVVLPTVERDESQVLHCHRRCLRERLVADVPRHPALEEEDSRSGTQEDHGT